MTESNQVDALFETLAKILLRCFLFGYLLLLIWFVAFLSAGAVMQRILGELFGLTPHEMDMTHYFGMAFVKCVVLLFFLFPYIAIRLVLRKRP